jgi:hypothetical protein
MALVDFGRLTKYIEPLTQQHLQNEEKEEDSLELPDDSPPATPPAAVPLARPSRVRLPPPPAPPRAKGCLDFADPPPLLGSPVAAAGKKTFTTTSARQRTVLAAGGGEAATAPSKLLLPFSKLDEPAQVVPPETCHFKTVVLSIDELIARLASTDAPSFESLVLTRAQ